MTAIHQLGFQSYNLMRTPELSKFSGAIISPVNSPFEEVINQTHDRTNLPEDFTFIFDPQLYSPRNARDMLKNWDYFPNDLDTSDLSDINWWKSLNEKLLDVINRLDIHSLCTPIIIPSNFSEDYYDLTIEVGEELRKISQDNLDIYQTVIINIHSIDNEINLLTIASIITKTRCKKIYLLFYAPSVNLSRRELSDESELLNSMKLIQLLKENNLSVTVGYTSSEFLLWKFAGADNCCTGKFLNLRRFEPSRYQIPEENGGGIVPYLFVRSLLGYFRGADLVRVQEKGLISQKTIENPFFTEIYEKLFTPAPWLALSWKHYLFEFQELEAEINNKQEIVIDLLREADNNWGFIESQSIILDERLNNGSWIRPWLRSILSL